jgi:DNA ligase-1
MPTTQVNETLYKMDSKGKIRQWEINTGEDDAGPFYEQVHGLQGGKLQATRTRVVAGKNIGRSNETTAAEQAQMEAESLWTKKRDRSGYSVKVPKDKPRMPMLAKTYEKGGKVVDGGKIKWPAYAQPKLDGIRCFAEITAKGVTLKSRTGKVITSLPHINAALAELFIQDDAVKMLHDDTFSVVKKITLDGELYNHEYKDDFQDLVSLIKRDKPNEKSPLAQFHCYDVCCDKTDFEGRLHMLNCLAMWTVDDTIQVVPTVQVESDSDFKERYSKFMDVGYEGAMIRNASGVYQYNRRSPDLQKFKDFMDGEFEIVGAYMNKGKHSKQCTLLCVTEDGTEFGVKPKGDEAQREQYAIDYFAGKLTGKMLTVRYFELTTSENPVPRFPVGICVRDYE